MTNQQNSIVRTGPEAEPGQGGNTKKIKGQETMVIHETSALEDKRNPNTKSTQTHCNRNTKTTFAHVR